MRESIPEMLRTNPGPRIGGGVDVHVVIAHVVGEPVKYQGLVERIFKRTRDLVFVHSPTLHHSR